MLLALGRRYVCRTRTRSNLDALYLLLSQFSASPSMTTSAQGQGGTISPTPNTSNADWRAHNTPLFPKKKPQFHLDSLFDALRSFEQEDDDDGPCTPTATVDICFEHLGFRGFQPSESLVLKVLSTYGNTELSLSSYLAVFEWAGQKTFFFHTPNTFDALNKILAGLNPILLKDLVNVLDFGHYRYRAFFYNALFVAYLIARLPGLASHILDLLLDEGLNTPASYNKLVNVLLQHKSFAEADAVLDSLYYDGQISLEPNNINIRTTPNLEWDQANREYLRGLARSSDPFEARFLGGHALITLVRDHCGSKRFKDAADLIDEFKELSSFKSNKPYEIWITSTYRYAESYFAAPKIADQMQTANEACNPDIVRHSTSLIGLVAENRFEAASQLLTEMKELQFMPRKPTVSESMFSFLINLLCGCENDKTCCILAGAPQCCKEANFDRLIQVVRLRFRFEPGTPQLPGAFRNFLFNKLISALCRAGRVEDAYSLYGEFNMTCWRVFDGEYYFGELISTTDETCYQMIHGFRRINREDVADRLLLEMHKPYPYRTK